MLRNTNVLIKIIHWTLGYPTLVTQGDYLGGWGVGRDWINVALDLIQWYHPIPESQSGSIHLSPCRDQHSHCLRCDKEWPCQVAQWNRSSKLKAPHALWAIISVRSSQALRLRLDSSFRDSAHEGQMLPCTKPKQASARIFHIRPTQCLDTYTLFGYNRCINYILSKVSKFIGHHDWSTNILRQSHIHSTQSPYW